MEFEGVGARCSLTTCAKFDYLPIKCTHCSRPFCESHHLPSQHSCTAHAPRRVPTCPMCGAAVPPSYTGQSLDDAMAAHIDGGCARRQRSNPVCAHDGCNIRDVAATRCDACRKVFCIKHCVQINHECPLLGKQPSPSNAFNKQFQKNKMRQQRENLQKVTTNQSANAASNSKTIPEKTKKQVLPSLSKSKVLKSTTTPSTSNSSYVVVSTHFANTVSSPLGHNVAEITPDDRLFLSVLFNTPPPSNTAAPSTTPSSSSSASATPPRLVRPRHMVFSARNTPARIIDIVRKQVPEVPAPPSGQRYCVYAARPDMSRVNLLPFITPLSDLSSVVSHGDLLIVALGENGLDPAVVNALKTAARSGHFNNAVNSGTGAGTAGSVFGRKISSPLDRSNAKCIMA